jgi:ABC-type branched-subunit amino acid transport system permease subunit
MSSYVLFLLLGLGSGAVYSTLALGLVLKYRSAGVVDFSHGAVAMFCAYVYLNLRSNGALVFPWIVIPHKIQIASAATGIPVLVSIVASLAYAAILGLIFYVAIVRPLRHAPALAKVAASVGLLLYLQTVATLNFGSTAFSSPPILPAKAVHVFGTIVPSDRLYLTGIVIVLSLVLGVVYRRTRFGLATRAAAGNEKGASLIGLSATRLAAYNWILATVLAGAAGILILPITTLNPGTYTLFVIPALGAALLGRFSSFPITVAAGLGIGMLQSELIKLQTVWDWLPKQGLQDGVPFVIIMLAMVVLAGRLPSRGGLRDTYTASIGRPRTPLRTTGISFVIGLVAILVFSELYRSAIAASLITACICLSVVIITGYVGQISLAQNALAGISAFMVSHIAGGLGIGFPFGLILAALCAVVVGVVVGLPAVRVRGVNLAVVTLALAAALDALVFNADWFSGGFTGRTVPSPHLFGLNLGVSNAGSSTVFAIFVLVIVCLMGLFVAKLRNAPAGRMFIAVRANERAASSVGVNVARTKLLAFAVSAFVAGIGGGLMAYQQANINASSFTLWSSLTILAITYVGGIGRIAGAVAAGFLLASNGVMATLLDKLFAFNQYQALIAGLAMILTAIGNPDGIAKEMQGTYAKALGLLARRRAGDSTGGPTPPVAVAAPAETKAGVS